MTAEQQAALGLVSPLVLDLNGDGVQTLSLTANVSFDLNATGTAINTGWVGEGDGLLAIDVNGDGTIDNGSELFGSSFVLGDGTTAKNGFEALGSLDGNGDGVINADDQSYSSLLVWQDANQDGVSQSNELSSLSSLGITGINTGATQTSELNNGNWIGLSSSYDTVDGTTYTIADVWFQTDATGVQNTGNVDQTTTTSADPSLNQSIDSLISAMASFEPASAATIANKDDQAQTYPIMLAVTQ